MIRGIGVDIVRTERFRHWLEDRKKLNRFFHSREIEWCLSQHDGAASLAVRYAAREAFAKALGTGLRNLSFSDVWVNRDEQGKPFLCLSDRAMKALENSGASNTHISLSHERDYAVALVVIE